MSTDHWAVDFTGYAVHKLRQDFTQVARCARALEVGQVWERTSPRTNSVGNLILHLTGNVRQWIIGGVGRAVVERDRPAEFAERGPLPVGPLLADLEHVVTAACDIIERLDQRELESSRTIQGYNVAVLVAVMHVVEHFSWHAGQIVHMTRTLCDADLSMYDAQGRQLDQTRNWP